VFLIADIRITSAMPVLQDLVALSRGKWALNRTHKCREKEACFCAFGRDTKKSTVGCHETRRTAGPAAIHGVKQGMPIMSTDGDVLTALIGPSSVLGWCHYPLSGFMHMRIQRTTASFFCRKPFCRKPHLMYAIGMLSAKAGKGASCAQGSSHRKRGL
jgi:hypothetical protein